ncbi:MAG TPA: dodecin family protein, partial [Rhizomicrobium sp.]
MAKKQTDSVYRIVDVVGVSEKSWEDAGRRAVETAAGSLRDLRVAEVVKMDMKVEDGKVTAFRTRVALSFKYEARGRRAGGGGRFKPHFAARTSSADTSPT